MPRGGMVHALEEINRLLRPVGTLIEIHPVTGGWIEVMSDSATVFAESDPGFDPDDELRPTENAVRTVLDRGMFALDADREFDLRVYSSSIRELHDYLSMVGGYDETPTSPKIMHLWEELYQRAEQAMDLVTAEAQVVYGERARISRIFSSR